MTALLSRRHVILALAGVALVLVTYPRFAWSLSPEHFFRADDWDWLSNAALLRVPGYADLWPRWIYNDRPCGALLITAVYRLAGLDNVVFHGVWVAIHLLNTLLVFAVESLLANLLAASRSQAEETHIRTGRLNKRRLFQPFRAGGTESEAA